jgi:hypothetical protein
MFWLWRECAGRKFEFFFNDSGGDGSRFRVQGSGLRKEAVAEALTLASLIVDYLNPEP